MTGPSRPVGRPKNRGTPPHLRSMADNDLPFSDTARLAAVKAAQQGSRSLYRAMLSYGVKHGHLLSLSKAQILVRASGEGIA